jgi:hypothetical protein
VSPTVTGLEGTPANVLNLGSPTAASFQFTIPVGATGATGPQGATGAVGATGPQGATGLQGAQGTVGTTGTKGATGAVGAQGAVGPQGATGAQGSAGANGSSIVGAQGSAGAAGAQGSAGAAGAQGSAGTPGIQGNNAGLRYNFSTTTTDADPGAGGFRYNNATVGSVTQIFIDIADVSSTDISAFIDTWDDSTATVKGYVVIDSNANLDVTYTVFRLNSITTVAGYRKLNVTYLSGTAPSNFEECVIQFYRTGDNGTNGSAGAQGATGTAGAQGATGTAGAQGATGTAGAQGAVGAPGSSPGGFSGLVTINQPPPFPPINLDFVDGILVNVF